MKKILIIFLLVSLVLPLVYSAQQKVYILNLKYDEGKVTKESLIVTRGMFSEESQPETGYRLELISFAGEIIYTRKFSFPELQKGPLPKESDILEREKYLPNIKEKEHSILRTSSVELMIPYYEDAKTIRIYDVNDINVLEIDVSSFSERAAIDETSAEKVNPTKSLFQRIADFLKRVFGLGV